MKRQDNIQYRINKKKKMKNKLIKFSKYKNTSFSKSKKLPK